MLRSGRFWFAFVFAAVLLLPGLYLTGRTLYRLLTYERAQGAAGFESRGRRGISTYRITYSADGKSYSIRDSAASWLGLGYGAEEPVKVLYPADDPADGVVASFYGLWFWQLFILLAPLIFIMPVAKWVLMGVEDNRLAAIAAEGQAERDRDRERRSAARKRARRNEEY
jgi:hypothetical protein